MGVFTCFETPYYFLGYSVIFVKHQNDLTRKIWGKNTSIRVQVVQQDGKK